LPLVGPDGQPDVVPLAFEFDGHEFWVGGVGDAVVRTRKFRNVAAGNDRVALVFALSSLVNDIGMSPFVV
jgi:pyridoxamine 5'-phosphate oxidase family protein